MATTKAVPVTWWRTPGGITKAILVVAVVGFMVRFVGLSTIGETLLKVIAAVGISVALFVGLNKLFGLAYDRWATFSALAGAAVGFVGFLVLDGNRLLRDLDPRPWAWAAIGAIVVGLSMFLFATTKTPAQRLPLGIALFGGIGVMTSLALSSTAYPELDWPKLVVLGAAGAGLGVLRRTIGSGRSPARVQRSAITGLAIGLLVGAWGGADIGAGTFAETTLATAVPLALLGVARGLGAQPTPTERRALEEGSRSWIFATPALLFIVGGLLAPLLRTVFLSFRSRDASELVGFDNYSSVIRSPSFFTASRWNWGNIVGSRLLWIAVVFFAASIAIGVVNGRRAKRSFAASPGSTITLLTGAFLASCLVLGTLRGSIVNNLWWVVVVTTMSTAIGLAVAVLADRAKGENVAKSLIFLPMAISFVGAGVIWTLVYQPRNVRRPQTGVLNALWIGLGELSNSAWKWAVLAVLLGAAGALVALALTGIRIGNWTRAGTSLGVASLLAAFAILLVTRGIGGFVRRDGEVVKQIIEPILDAPYNNLWLMVVLIWIQSGFAMVILSSAIKAVPTEFIEAAKIDGATETQTFWRITVPQILPTIGVVVTTTIVSVMKVYDIVQVMTGGQYQTQVIAFDMIREINSSQNFGRSSTYATLLFVLILPVMVYNIRGMQKAKN